MIRSRKNSKILDLDKEEVQLTVNAWNGIKAVGEFIADAVLGLILDAIELTINLLLDTFMVLANKVLGYSITKSNGIYNISGKSFGFKRFGLGFELTLPGSKIIFTDILKLPDLNVETLSPRVDGFAAAVGLMHVAANLVIPDISHISQEWNESNNSIIYSSIRSIRTF